MKRTLILVGMFLLAVAGCTAADDGQPEPDTCAGAACERASGGSAEAAEALETAANELVATSEEECHRQCFNLLRWLDVACWRQCTSR